MFGFEGAGMVPGMTRRPVGQAAKTAASHAANVGSIPARVTKCAFSSVGRATDFSLRLKSKLILVLSAERTDDKESVAPSA